jgi:hypothetical protein
MSDKSDDKIKTLALAALLRRGLENKNFSPAPEQIRAWEAENLPQNSEKTHTPFDLILVVAEDDLRVTAKYLDLYKTNLCPEHIVIITKNSERTKALFSGAPVSLLDEDEIMPGLTYESIRSLNKVKTGWYFQQFIKMAYAKRCEKEYYLIFDGDTVPLTPLSFFHEENGVFIRKGEFFAPYFKMIETLFSGQVKRETDFSFISESMLINKRIMLELITTIENNVALPGEYFFEKILHAVCSSGLAGRDFSEYETYGNYVMRYYKEQYSVMRIRSLREAMKFFTSLPEIYILNYMARDFDTVSFEKKHILGKQLGLQEYINKCFTC